MFSFQVRKKGEPRMGSIVSVPLPVGDEIKVVVMWEDDLSFEAFRVDEIQAVGAQDAPDNLIAFPGGSNETH